MKKFSKLLCAVLVLALLSSSLAFMVSAEENVAGDPAADGESLPSVTLTDTASNDPASYRDNSEDNELSSANLSQYEGDYSFKVVTNPDGSDYFRLETKKDGQPAGHFQWSIFAEEPIVYSTEAPMYAVYDFDIGTETYLTALCFVPNIRTGANGEGWDVTAGGSNVYTVDMPNVDTNSFNHLSIVIDYNSNAMHYFLNGSFLCSRSDIIKKDLFAEFKNGRINDNVNYSGVPVEGSDYIYTGVKIQAHKTYGYTPLTMGETFAVDNLKIKVLAGEEAGNLAEALAAGDITAWSGNIYTDDYKYTDILDIATVNGVGYSSTSALETVLATVGNDQCEVEFLAIPMLPVSLKANAIIDTNGFDLDSLVTLDKDCEIVSTDGDLVTVSAPVTENKKVEPISTGSILGIVKAPNADNDLASIQYNNYNAENFRGVWVIKDTITGSQVILDAPYGGEIAANANTYIDWHGAGESSNYAYRLGKNQFIIFDIDFAFNNTSENTRKVNLNPITRNSGNSGVWGNTSGYIDDIYLAAGIANGEFAHLTAVLSPDTRAMSVFVNGRFVSTVNNAINGMESGYYFNGFRTFSSSNDIAMYSNVSMRCVYSEELANAIEVNNIGLWSGNLFVGDYEFPKLPSIATVDGVPYYTAESLESALYGNLDAPVTVKVLHTFPETITVNCDAVINTYGFNVNFVDGSGNKLEAVNNVIEYNAPYIENRIDEVIDFSQIKGNTSSIPEIFTATLGSAKANLYDSFSVVSKTSVSNWGTLGYRNATIITNPFTGDTIYMESSKVGDGYGVLNEDNEYSNFNFSSTAISYESGKNEYFVADLDFAYQGELDNNQAFVLIPRGATGYWGSNIRLSELPVPEGKLVHLTMVFDLTSSNAYIFIDGVLETVVPGGAINQDGHSAYLGGNKGIKVAELKLGSNSLNTVLIDNVNIRFFDLANGVDTLDDAIASAYISDWTDNIYTDSYRTTRLPAVAEVDGVEYITVDSLSEALSKESDGVKKVDIKHTPDGIIKVTTDAEIETHGLDVEFDWQTGLYEFEGKDKYYVCTGTDYAYASNKIAHDHIEGETVHKFVTINKDNCDFYATCVIWFNEIDPEDVDVVYYVYGDKIEPVSRLNYVSGGKLYTSVWHSLSEELEVGAAVDSFPTASKELPETWYSLELLSSDADFAASDLLYNANISSNITFTFYVNMAQTVTRTGESRNIDGKDYVSFIYTLAPHEIDKLIDVEFEVEDGEGNTYVQIHRISFIEYITTILESNESELKKKAIVGLLNYANEAHALFESGEKIGAVTELLETYGSLLPEAELPEKQDTSALSSVIRSAYLRLNSAPEFVFKVAKGFNGTITFTYESLENVVEQSVYVNTQRGEQLIVLNSFNIFDIHAEISITATPEGSDVSLVGKYSLATYAQGLESNAFATALYTYSVAANEYRKTICILTVDGKVVAEYNKGDTVIVPFSDDRYDFSWFIVDGENKTPVDLSSYVITKDIALTYTKSLKKTVIAAADVLSETLKTIVTGKIKQCDQSFKSQNPTVDPFIEGGNPVYVLVDGKDGRSTEALYFSRSIKWTGKEGHDFTEFRFAVNGEQKGPAVKSFSFDYLVSGTVEENREHEFTDLKGNKFYTDAYVQVKTFANHPLAGDNYPELSGTDLILDGQWHTMTVTFDEPLVIIDILVNLYHFQGELVVSNLAIEYVS